MAAPSVIDEVVYPAPGLSAREREAMILKFAPLVRYVVGRMALVVPQVFDTADLIGYGTIGLIEAVAQARERHPAYVHSVRGTAGACAHG